MMIFQVANCSFTSMMTNGGCWVFDHCRIAKSATFVRTVQPALMLVILFVKWLIIAIRNRLFSPSRRRLLWFVYIYIYVWQSIPRSIYIEWTWMILYSSFVTSKRSHPQHFRWSLRLSLHHFPRLCPLIFCWTVFGNPVLCFSLQTFKLL